MNVAYSSQNMNRIEIWLTSAMKLYNKNGLQKTLHLHKRVIVKAGSVYGNLPRITEFNFYLCLFEAVFSAKLYGGCYGEAS